MDIKRRFQFLKHLNNTQTAWIIWLLYIVGICLVTILSGYTHTVANNYFIAAHNWLQGAELYSHSGQGFIYFPQSAIFYLPLAALPAHVSEIVWRIINIGLFAYGIFKFSTLINVNRPKVINYFLMMTLFTLPLAFSSARNGQMNLLIGGLMLLSVTFITQKRWWSASLLLALGLALKPTSLVWLLLIAALYPRQMIWRLLIGIAILLIVPFFTQQPSYVLLQYRAALDMLHDVNTISISTLYTAWAQFFTLLQTFGLKVPLTWATLIRLLAALGTLLLCFKAKNKFDLKQAGFYLYTLATCYLLLFNPISENNDYAILAPVLGIIAANAFVLQQYFKLLFIFLCEVVLIFTYYIATSFIPDNPSWLAPIVVIVFVIAVIRWMMQQPKSIE